MGSLMFLGPVPLPHSRDLGLGLEKLGYPVRYWYLRASASHYPWRSLDGGRLEEVIEWRPGRILRMFREASSSRLVVIVGWHSAIQVALAAFCFVRGIRFVYWLDGIEAPKTGARKAIKKRLLQLADGYFITGKRAIDVWTQYYGLGAEHCFDFPYLENKPNLREVIRINRQRIAKIRSGGAIRILVSNRFLPRKGYEALLEGLLSLRREIFSKIEIEVLGDGPGRGVLEKSVPPEKGIRFRGWVEYSEYLTCLERCDIFIHASLHEPFGIPPVDAMAFGKAVICSTGVFSCSDRIENGKNGMVFHAGDSRGICESVSWLVENPEEIYRIGKAAMKTSAEFGVEYNLRSILEAVAVVDP